MKRYLKESVITLADSLMQHEASMKLSRVMIKVKDYRQSFEFYKNTLGLKMFNSWQRKDSWGALFSVGTATIEIIWYPTGPGLNDCNYILERDKLEIDLEVNDVDIQHRRLIAAGVTVVDAPHDVPWGFRQFTIKDPDNISIVLSQPLPGK
jgi:catechol 2,3-dioxygenase-like lactoylglutathione lyase family enzyme